VGNRLSFDELRTRWITGLAGNPDMRGGAMRLLYKQPLSEHLAEVNILSLKRIVETAIDDDPEDWTVEMAGQDWTQSSPVLAKKKITATQNATKIAKSSSSELLVPGHILKGRFVLEEPLGRGGSGVVYRARDRLRQRTNAVTDQIALKVLDGDSFASPLHLDALQHEALLTQGLSHPNIVRVYDFHRDGDTCFLTMELLEGQLLKTLFAAFQPSVVSKKRAVKIIEGMCLGLAYAHANGLVHADFKPGNVFLTAADEPKILDFGLAHLTKPDAQSGDASSKPTVMALRATTPAYASCSRLEGRDPVFSDDVYSLSCVIYELLSGRHPYQRKSATEARELRLKPVRIDGLTDLQWRTLATGLQLSSVPGATEVHDLLTAFRAPPPPKPARVPVAKKRARSWTLSAAVVGFLAGVGLVFAVTLLDIKPVDTRYVDMVRESKFIQFVQSTLGVAKDESGSSEAVTLPATSPEVENISGTLVVDSAEAPAAPEPDTGANNPESLLPTIADGDAGEIEAVDDSGTNELVAVPGEEIDVAIDDSSPESPEEATVLAATTGAPGFQLGSDFFTIEENGQALAVEIFRQGNLSTPASVELTTYAVSAESALDFADFDRHEIRFAIGEASKTVFIPIVADALPERSEVFRIVLGNSLGEMILTERAAATVFIIDDDT
jgi:serine/threonine protein kinase